MTIEELHALEGDPIAYAKARDEMVLEQTMNLDELGFGFAVAMVIYAALFLVLFILFAACVIGGLLKDVCRRIFRRG